MRIGQVFDESLLPPGAVRRDLTPKKLTGADRTLVFGLREEGGRLVVLTAGFVTAIKREISETDRV